MLYITAEKELVVFCAQIKPMTVPSTEVFHGNIAKPEEPNTGPRREETDAIFE